MMPQAPVVDVCAQCRVTTLRAAVSAAAPGTIVRVRDRQGGNVVVRVPLTIVGGGGEIAAERASDRGIDVRARGVVIRDLTMRGFGGADPSGRTAAIVLESEGTRIERVSFVDNTFALSALNAARGVVVNSRFASSGAGGDPIRFWHSRAMRIEDTSVDGGRDVFISWSPGVTVRHSTFRHLRYGLHDMFSPGMIVENNTFERCEIGTNFMYAQGLRVRGNRFVRNAGATGYGVGLEDTDDATFENNAFLANHVGMNLVDSPADPNAPLRIVSNLFADNGAALSLQSTAHALTVVGNAFAGNIEAVQVSGGNAEGVAWTEPSGGNYWSDYAGYDASGTGFGKIPYRPRSTFEAVLDANPDLQMFRYGAAADAIDFATRAIAAQPAPKLTDTKPLIHPPARTYAAAAPQLEEEMPLTLDAAVVPVAALPLALMLVASRRRRLPSRAGSPRKLHAVGGIALQLNGITKTYRSGRGIHDVSLTLRCGESVALWGANGAGKTTLMRCILGQTAMRGRVALYGEEVDAGDLRLRRAIGYAPQHLPETDMPIADLVELLTRLRGANASDVRRTFAELGLDARDDRYAGELSGGLRQRFAVACALIGDPPLLVLDEPTAGLDRASRAELLRALERLRLQGKTLLFASHVLDDVRCLADRVVVIEDGRAVDDIPAVQFEERVS